MVAASVNPEQLFSGTSPFPLSTVVICCPISTARSSRSFRLISLLHVYESAYSPGREYTRTFSGVRIKSCRWCYLRRQFCREPGIIKRRERQRPGVLSAGCRIQPGKALGVHANVVVQRQVGADDFVMFYCQQRDCSRRYGGVHGHAGFDSLARPTETFSSVESITAVCDFTPGGAFLKLTLTGFARLLTQRRCNPGHGGTIHQRKNGINTKARAARPGRSLDYAL